MTRLLLIRHAESEWNAQGRWQGQADPELSPRGTEQARTAATNLTGFTGRRVISSPLRRARTTAEIIGEALKLAPVVVEDDLREVDVGGWSGLTRAEIAERYPEDWRLLEEGRLERWPGGESREEFRARVLAAVERIAAANDGDEVLVVTHGGAIASLERMLGVHPGVGVDLLGGRWFEFGASVSASVDRVTLLDQRP